MSDKKHGNMSDIGLIAGREISTRAREKSFIISTLLTMAVMVIGLLIWSHFSGRESVEKVGVVGDAPSISETLTATGEATGNKLDVATVPDEADARKQITDGDLKAAVIVKPNAEYTLISDKALNSGLDGTLRSGISQYQLTHSLSERGVAAGDLPSATIDADQLQKTNPDEGQRIAIAMIGAILLMMAVLGGGVMVSVGVVEEKTSRIVEILLATVRPLHLLWGKIIGIGAISLAQMALFGGTALIAGAATGMLTITGTAVTMFAAVIAWFLLGFLFFAALYAAVGAMVGRQEELNGASTPLTFLAMGVLYAGIFGIQALDATWVQVLSWVPPFSAVLMPIRIATGDAGVMTIVGSSAVMIAACAFVVWASSRIYSRAVLRTGVKTNWGEVAGMLTGKS